MTVNRQALRAAEEAFIADPSIENRNKMIMFHTGIVHRVARKYSAYVSADRYNDLIQEGMLGLIQGAKKFDSSKEIKFVTYATWWVRAFIREYITSERSNQFNSIKKLVFDRNPNKPLKNEDTRRAGLRRAYSYTAPQSPDGFTWEEIIPDESIDLEKKQIKAQHIELLYTIAEPFLLNYPHKKKIFLERMVADVPKNLAELGKDLNKSREWVRICEKRLREEIVLAYREHCGL